MRYYCLPSFSAALGLACVIGATATAQDVPKLRCEVSWIANTHGGGEGRKPNGDALQGGVYQDGKLIWSIDIPWGGGGVAIAGDDQHIYASNQRGFTRYERENGKSTGWKALTTNFVTGLCAAGGKVYASDYYSHKIHVFEGEKEVLAFDAHFPGALAVNKEGRIFVAQFEDPWNQPAVRIGTDRNKVLRFTPDGKPLPPIELGAASRPVALWIDRETHLLAADNGPDQDIKIFSDLNTTPKLAGTFGEKGGVFKGTPGLYGPKRFYGISGIGTDAAGNFYISQRPGAGQGSWK